MILFGWSYSKALACFACSKHQHNKYFQLRFRGLRNTDANSAKSPVRCASFYSYLKMDNRIRNINTCDECNSEYYSDTSQMANLCPECSHVLYEYRNCEHEFSNGRCIRCFWNGNASDYIKGLKEKQINKNKSILQVVDFFQGK